MPVKPKLTPVAGQSLPDSTKFWNLTQVSPAAAAGCREAKANRHSRTTKIARVLCLRPNTAQILFEMTRVGSLHRWQLSFSIVAPAAHERPEEGSLAALTPDLSVTSVPVCICASLQSSPTLSSLASTFLDQPSGKACLMEVRKREMPCDLENIRSCRAESLFFSETQGSLHIVAIKQRSSIKIEPSDIFCR